MYQEKESTFSSNGKIYDLNTLFRLTDKSPILRINVDQLIWVLPHIQSIDKARVKRADVHVPILVTKEEGKELVVDGLHRLARAVMLHMQSLPFKRVTEEMMQEALLGKSNKPVFSKWK